ncbi:hypothetical protein BC831DRAFT_451921 [Entophlyctis helioformis]|nr:hypothetical protein BC831DRAFT_451921 [Entophlyctis helioformis]
MRSTWRSVPAAAVAMLPWRETGDVGDAARAAARPSVPRWPDEPPVNDDDRPVGVVMAALRIIDGRRDGLRPCPVSSPWPLPNVAAPLMLPPRWTDWSSNAEPRVVLLGDVAMLTKSTDARISCRALLGRWFAGGAMDSLRFGDLDAAVLVGLGAACASSGFTVQGGSSAVRSSGSSEMVMLNTVAGSSCSAACAGTSSVRVVVGAMLDAAAAAAAASVSVDATCLGSLTGFLGSALFGLASAAVAAASKGGACGAAAPTDRELADAADAEPDGLASSAFQRSECTLIGVCLRRVEPSDPSLLPLW